MRAIDFAFGVHLHQPLGNFDHVFESAYEHSYLPFMKTIEQFERVKAAVHVTGTLWEWLEAHHPEYFDLLQRLSDRGQIEVLGVTRPAGENRAQRHTDEPTDGVLHLLTPNQPKDAQDQRSAHGGPQRDPQLRGETVRRDEHDRRQPHLRQPTPAAESRHD